MLKALVLIGMIFVGSLFAAGADAALSDDLGTQLRYASIRAINAATFETMAAQSAMAADDDARATLNTSLTQRFTQMERDLGVSTTLTLHTIETKDNATSACTYYSDAKSTLLTLMQALTEKLDKRESE
jgi:hypothetical protein